MTSLSGFRHMSVNAGTESLRASTLNVSTHEMPQRAMLEFVAGQLGEEMGAILHGEFEVDAAGEHYRLLTGQVIVIPAGEPRCYRAVSATGKLYRVVVAKPLATECEHGR